jgi:hypothetical protein
VTVVVEDAYGNIVTSDNSTVTLTLSSGALNGGHLSLSAGASDGVAAFGALAVDSGGVYDLIAGDGSLAGATSKSFTIT